MHSCIMLLEVLMQNTFMPTHVRVQFVVEHVNFNENFTCIESVRLDIFGSVVDYA